MNDSAELKALQVRQTELITKYKGLTQELRVLQGKLHTIKNEKAIVSEAIRRLVDTSKRPVITEHAILRYCERVLGVSIDEIKEKILPSGMEKTVVGLKNAKIPVGDSHVLIVKNGIVNTVVTKEMPECPNNSITE